MFGHSIWLSGFITCSKEVAGIYMPCMQVCACVCVVPGRWWHPCLTQPSWPISARSPGPPKKCQFGFLLQRNWPGDRWKHVCERTTTPQFVRTMWTDCVGKRSRLSRVKFLTLAKVEPLPSDSMVMVWVRLWRIWSMSSSQNFEPSSSSSIRAP